MHSTEPTIILNSNMSLDDLQNAFWRYLSKNGCTADECDEYTLNVIGLATQITDRAARKMFIAEHTTEEYFYFFYIISELFHMHYQKMPIRCRNVFAERISAYRQEQIKRSGEKWLEGSNDGWLDIILDAKEIVFTEEEERLDNEICNQHIYLNVPHLESPRVDTAGIDVEWFTDFDSSRLCESEEAINTYLELYDSLDYDAEIAEINDFIYEMERLNLFIDFIYEMGRLNLGS